MQGQRVTPLSVEVVSEPLTHLLADAMSPCLSLSITKGDLITITYGDADDGKAVAPTAVGASVFTVAVRGTSDGALQSLYQRISLSDG